MCVTQYREGKVFQNDTYIFNAEVITGIPLGSRIGIFGFFLIIKVVLIYSNRNTRVQPKF